VSEKNVMELYFRYAGDIHKEPLIILHGLFGMSDNWMTLAKKFGENNFTVFVPDARNHGLSPHDDEFNYDVMAEDMLAFMKDEDYLIPSASFIGHSMGGKTAMLFAARHPELVKKLIVVDMSPRSYESTNAHVVEALQSIDLDKFRTRQEVEQELLTRLDDDLVTTQFLMKSLVRLSQRQVVVGGDGLLRKGKLEWKFNLDAIAKNLNRTGDALPDDAAFNGPTLFIRGEKSNYISDADEPIIKKHFPNSEIKTVAGAGHWVHAENPKGFMEVALSFLKG
jgi:esterase